MCHCYYSKKLISLGNLHVDYTRYAIHNENMRTDENLEVICHARTYDRWTLWKFMTYSWPQWSPCMRSWRRGSHALNEREYMFTIAFHNQISMSVSQTCHFQRLAITPPQVLLHGASLLQAPFRPSLETFGEVLQPDGIPDSSPPVSMYQQVDCSYNTLCKLFMLEL